MHRQPQQEPRRQLGSIHETTTHSPHAQIEAQANPSPDPPAARSSASDEPPPTKPPRLDANHPSLSVSDRNFFSTHQHFQIPASQHHPCHTPQPNFSRRHPKTTTAPHEQIHSGSQTPRQSEPMSQQAASTKSSQGTSSKPPVYTLPAKMTEIVYTQVPEYISDTHAQILKKFQSRSRAWGWTHNCAREFFPPPPSETGPPALLSGPPDPPEIGAQTWPVTQFDE